MFGIGSGELIMLMILALIIIGPQKLPEMGRTVGKALAQFKAYTEDMRAVLTMEQTGIAPTSHFPGIGGTQAYRGATEQITTSKPSAVEPIEATNEVSSTVEPVAVFVPEQPAMPPRNYFSEELTLEPESTTATTRAPSITTHN